jgi:hypothetical protein
MSKGDPVTYEELTSEHKQKFNEIKALFEANLTRSFERTRHHGIRWKRFSPEGALDGVDLSLPSEERTRALRQEVNYMVAHSLHRHSESLVNTFEHVTLHIVQEIMKNQYSPSGPTLGSHKGELSFQTKPPLPYTLVAPKSHEAPAYVVYIAKHLQVNGLRDADWISRSTSICQDHYDVAMRRRGPVPAIGPRKLKGNTSLKSR